ncbi:putative Sel1 repeat [Trypanosoma vivax]|uniref:Uncharacterized protein n=1 Tax=Trypanosoma vivax (strain Y486) TaxID=1055687 RepID=G0U060_TRYVY|nr:hypothetical protein TRVL_02585 [Trypanosoma vivax]KAH8613943.1 putative Sel1 repeat [Trypanosoma vivax]CCC49457.1 conserved hypothetical protein [Trypanosoma vivax Y486]
MSHQSSSFFLNHCWQQCSLVALLSVSLCLLSVPILTVGEDVVGDGYRVNGEVDNVPGHAVSPVPRGVGANLAVEHDVSEGTAKNTSVLSSKISLASRRASRRELAEIYRRAIHALHESNNLTDALLWIREGAAQGHSRLHWLLGVLHATGIGVPRSDAHAILHYTFAALDGVPEAHMALGARYRDGKGIPRNCEAAVAHYREVADAVAMTYDGLSNPSSASQMYDQNTESGSWWYSSRRENSLHVMMYRADSGATDAIIALGYAYFKGRHGVQRDWHRARQYFLEAMEKGDVAAYGALGQLYAAGDAMAQPAIKRDFVAAASYFEKGSMKKDGTSLNGMGYLHAVGYYEKGKPRNATAHVQPDFTTAVNYFSEAINRGNVEAMYNLGVLMMHGKGVPQDPAGAVQLFEAAALRGSVLSLWQLARHEHMRGKCQRALLLYTHVVSFGSMFEHPSRSSSFPSVVEGSVSFTSDGSDSLAQLLETLAFAEAGHVASRLKALEMLDGFSLIEEAEDELLSGVFAKSGKPPERVDETGTGVLRLHWYHDSLDGSDMKRMHTLLSSVETKAHGVSATRNVGMLLSQREALHMLRLQLLKMSAHSGDSDAELRIGDFYYNGESHLIGVKMSHALMHYEIAAKRYNIHALFKVGYMYQLGLGVSPDDRGPVTVKDAIYRIITHAAVDGDDGHAELSGVHATSKLSAMEMRLSMAKRFYDMILEIDKGNSVYAVRLALMSLNLQWWWLYFSHQLYGFSKALRLSMPNARVSHAVRVDNVVKKVREDVIEKVAEAEDAVEEDIADIGRWKWDDYVLLCNTIMLFAALLLRHHGA